MRLHTLSAVLTGSVPTFLAVLVLLNGAPPAAPEASEALATFPASVSLGVRTGSPYVFRDVFALNLPPFESRAWVHSTFGLQSLKDLGARQLRWPNGCFADGYDWQSSTYHFNFPGVGDVQAPVMPVDDVFALANDMGASVLWTVNVETKGVPDPCGWIPLYPGTGSESQNKAVLLQDVRDLVRRHGSRISAYELGNEPWGSWRPEDYVPLALEFAHAIKEVDSYAKVGIVGYPTTGNNQSADPNVQPSSTDARWTRLVQAALQDRTCGSTGFFGQKVPCLDFVTDHGYVWAGYSPLASNYPSNFRGAAAFFPVGNWNWILDQRLRDYWPATLALTEWNLKCWQVGTASPLPLANPGFEQGQAGWGYWERYPGTGILAIVPAARTGTQALRVSMTGSSGNAVDNVQASQPVSLSPSGPRQLLAVAWVKTATPAYAQLIVQQVNAGPHQWWHLGESTLSSSVPNAWQGVSVYATGFGDTTQVQVVLRATKSLAQWHADPTPVEVVFDDVVLEDRTGFSGANPSVETVEHGLFVGESLLLAADKGVGAAHYHTLERGSCGLYVAPDILSPQGEAFRLVSQMSGADPRYITGPARQLQAFVASPMFTTPPNSCTAPGCLVGGRDLPLVSAYAARVNNDGELLLYLFNRHASQAADVSVDLSGVGLPLSNRRTISRLQATGFTDRAFQTPAEVVETGTYGSAMAVSLPPISATRVRLGFQRGFDVTAQAVCADGSLPAVPRGIQTFWTRWPPNLRSFRLDWRESSPSTSGTVTTLAEADHVTNFVYFGLMVAGSDWGQVLSPLPPLPHPAMRAGTVFNPPTPMVNWRAAEVAAGNYTLKFRAPQEWCTSARPARPTRRIPRSPWTRR